MKRSHLLHAELSRVIASLGHGDTIVIGDAGLPIPHGPERIDLAVSRGVPTLTQVLGAVLSEMEVEAATIAQEALASDGRAPEWYPPGLDCPCHTVSHEEFKRLCTQARAVIRTGECTPYANILLRAGVAF